MVNITSFQQTFEKGLQDSKQFQTFISIPGSGMTTVIRDVSSSSKELNIVSIDFHECGEIDNIAVMNFIRIRLEKSLSEMGAIKRRDIKIFNDLQSNLIGIEEILENYNKQSLVIVLLSFEKIIEKLNPDFFEPLHRLIAKYSNNNDKKISFVICQEKFFDKHFVYNHLGEMSESYYSNLDFVSGFELAEVEEVLESTTIHYKEISKRIIELTAGNPKLVDRILDIISQNIDLATSFDQSVINEDYIVEDSIINYSLFNIWNSLSDIQKSILLGLADEKHNANFLQNTRLIVNNNEGKVQNNIIIIKSYITQISHHENKPKSEVKIETSVSMEKSRYNTDKLSSQEYSVFELFMKSPGKVITKEKIGLVMWGDKKKGKQKDWAIDQLMKRLRSKIGDNNASIIQTIRGRGYKID